MLNRPEAFATNMKTLNLELIDQNQPKYLQIANAIRHAIRAGQLKSGETLPSVRIMSEGLGVNRHTCMKALAELVAEGWLEAMERVGYKVVSDLPIESSLKLNAVSNSTSSHSNEANALNGTSSVKPFSFRLVKKGSKLPAYPASSFEFNFSGGQPDMSLFPYHEFKSHMSDVLSRPQISQLGYGDSAGLPLLREQVGTYLRRVRAITDREIVITNGSQEALFIVAQLLLTTGDCVAVEALGYPPAWSAFKSTGAELVGIEQDEFGIIPDDLEKKIGQNQIRLLYLTPLHQYPTTVTLSVKRRMQIYQLAAKHHIPIIEDDYDHEFHFKCQPLAPMASDDPHGLVIYLSTFSKIMFPSARIGMMAVSPQLAQAIAEYRLLINHKGNVLMQEALARWMQEGGFERHLRRVTRSYLQRRDNAVAKIAELRLFEFEIPDGGMALWLKLPKATAENFAEQCRNSDIYLQHESDFRLESADDENQYIRLGFAGMNEAKFNEGLAKLVTILRT